MASQPLSLSNIVTTYIAIHRHEIKYKKDKDTQPLPNELEAKIDSRIAALQTKILEYSTSQYSSSFYCAEWNKPMFVAEKQNDVDVLNELITNHYVNVNDISSYDGTVLHTAANNGHLNCIKVIMQSSNFINACNINAPDAEDQPAMNIYAHNAAGQTAMYLAVANNHTDVAKYLLDHGVLLDVVTPSSNLKRGYRWGILCESVYRETYVNIPQGYKQTAFHVAARSGNLNVLEFYLKHAPHLVNATDSNGMTALHLATKYKYYVRSAADRYCKQQSADLVKLLLTHHADVNAKDNLGKTPLHLTVEENFEYIEIARLLIEYHADVNAVDNNGQSALDYARNYARHSFNKDDLDQVMIHKRHPNKRELVEFLESVHAAKS